MVVASIPADVGFRIPDSLTCGARAGGVLPIMAYNVDWEAPPERGTFFRLQVYERVGISRAEVYEKRRKICHLGI